jgi:hypothetical protein
MYRLGRQIRIDSIVPIGDFRRRDPQLRPAGKTADNDAVRQHAEQRE